MLSVSRILQDIASGGDTAEAAIARSRRLIAQGDGSLRAFTALAPETPVTTDGPLAGIAVGVKDIFDTFDMPTAYGSPIHEGFRPASDAAVCAMIRARGGHIIGKTATTEFAFLKPTATLNPHDPAHTPGGSSSGSAAAVAAGMIPAAIGTQTGGSVIRPAAFCGVAGYKPSFRLFPATGMKTFAWSLDTVGFFAATVGDVALFTALLSRRDLTADPLPGAPRIGVYRSRAWSEVSDAMRGAIEDAAAIAAQAGAHVVDVDEPDDLARARDIHGTVQNHEGALSLGDEHARHRDALSPVLLAALDEGRAIEPSTYDDARRVARHARRAATGLFDDVDVLLTPSAPGSAPRDRSQTGSPFFNRLWTLTGNPTVNVPGLTDESGMPLGLQIVARFGRDKLALQAARWLEERLAARFPSDLAGRI